MLTEVWAEKWGGEWQKPKIGQITLLGRRGEGKTKRFRAEAWREGRA